jgi:hypothetical protein
MEEASVTNRSNGGRLKYIWLAFLTPRGYRPRINNLVLHIFSFGKCTFFDRENRIYLVHIKLLNVQIYGTKRTFQDMHIP